MPATDAYLGNPNLKKVNIPVEFTKDQIVEFQKCKTDPIYFMEKWMKIVSLDEGLISFKLYDFQKKIVTTIDKERFTICKSTACICILVYILWHQSSFPGFLAIFGSPSLK